MLLGMDQNTARDRPSARAALAWEGVYAEEGIRKASTASKVMSTLGVEVGRQG